ncbi:hypothetical protein ACD578_05215 [Microvirga sp. RSM25]|uniref:hypothetical protein n=1 Tax=Microvirga sp. RSM25 TaxID=3273802 RepID=UPI00384F629C
MMNKYRDGGPAFPQLDVESGQRDGHGDLIEPFTTSAGGMTLRDYLAAHAPISFEMAAQVFGDVPPFNDANRAAFLAVWALVRYEYADQMLRERAEDRA